MASTSRNISKYTSNFRYSYNKMTLRKKLEQFLILFPYLHSLLQKDRRNFNSRSALPSFLVMALPL